MQDIKDKVNHICSLISDTELDANTQNDICNNVTDLHRCMNKKIKTIYSDHKKELDNDREEYLTRLDNKQKELDKKIKELDDEDKIVQNIPNTFRRIAIIRQSLNTLFNEMWNKYCIQLNTKNINLEILAEKTDILKRKYIVNSEKGNGCKFALSIIYNIDPTIIFPINICELYIKLNDQFHPKIIPIDTTIREIQILRNEFHDNEHFLSSYGITIDVLNIIEAQLNNNKNVFNRS